MALVCDVQSVEATATSEDGFAEDNPDLEDGEIEDDDEEEETPVPVQPEPEPQEEQKPKILPAAVPETNVFNQTEQQRNKKHDRKSDKHLTEAEKSVRHLHRLERLEREQRERRERLRREHQHDDFASNIEKAIASILKKKDHQGSGEEEEIEDKTRGRKRKKKERDRKKKHRKDNNSPKTEQEEEENRANSPEKDEKSPGDKQTESEDSEYESEPFHNRQAKRFDRERKNRARNRENMRRERKNFKDKNRENKRNEQMNRAQMQENASICVFYMQGKCNKGDDCPFSHDALPPMKMELCKFYLMDCCAKRDKCLYMHSEFPCKYYHTGLKCFAKDNCKFAHGKPLSDALKQILLKHLETAPKEILGDFPRLTREGAHHMIVQTQKTLEIQFGMKNGTQPTEKSSIPSLFDITIPVPPELQMQLQNKTVGEEKPKEKTEKTGKVRHTRWNDDPPVPILNSAFMNPIFNSLNLQDQQKIQEYHVNFQLKRFYGEQDHDMRISSNGDVDMRSLPQMLPKTETSVNFDQFKLSENENVNSNATIKTETEDVKMDHEVPTDHFESNLTIDDKSGDSTSDLPSNLPRKQRELFLRIQAQQKENLPENQPEDDDENNQKDEDWYSSDEDNDPLCKMVIHLEEEPKEEKSPERVLSPPTIKPVEVIDKLGDLSKIDISAEVTKILTSMKSGQASSSNTSSTQESSKTSRDPRQAHTVTTASTERSTSPVRNIDPRSRAGRTERRDSRTTIYEQGYTNTDESKLSIYEQGLISTDNTTKDVDLRNLDLPKDLDMRTSAYGDIDLRQGGRQDVDLRQLGLQFKGIQNYTPATEIDASFQSHNPIAWKVYVVDVPRPDYTGLKLSSQDAQVSADPRLRKIFRVPSIDEKDSPMSPKNQSPPRTIRQDPRRRNLPKSETETKTDTNNLSYSQQLQLLQNSAFYQSLTSNQKVMLNQEIASKGDKTTPNDPILGGILSNLGLIPSLSAMTNGSAMNILNNVNSMVPTMAMSMNQNMMGGPNMNQMGPMGPNMGPNMPGGPNMGPNILPMGPNIPNPNMMPNPTMGPNLGPGLLGAAPGIPMGPNMNQNEFPMGFDPRSGGMLGQGPFPNFPPDNQNFNNYNDKFYPNEEANNFGNYNNGRNERNFRERNPNNRRGRSWNNRNNSRNFNRNNRNRSNRSNTPP